MCYYVGMDAKETIRPRTACDARDILRDRKVVLFDMDGTLIDSVGVWNAVDETLVARIAAAPAGDVQAERDAFLRDNRRTAEPYRAYCAYLKERYRSDKTPDEIYALRYDIAADYLENRVDYKPGADIFIRRLKAAGHTLAIVSTTARANMDVYRTRNRNIIRKANIDDYFSLLYTREDAAALKPDPEIYLRAMAALDASAADCLVFEDSLAGVEAAKRAGLTVVAVYDRYSDNDRAAIERLADWRIGGYDELIG